MLEIVDLSIIGTVAAAVIFFGILVLLKAGRWLGQRAIARYGTAGVPSVLDIEYPRLGWVRIDAIDQLLVNARAGMK